MRSILAVLFVFIYLLTWLPYAGIEYLLGKYGDRRKSDLRQLRYVQWAFRVVLFISGVKVTYLGDENIPKGEAVLYASNHRGIFDIVAAYSHLPDLSGFISKDSVAKVPILAMVMRRLYCLFLNREDPKEGLKTILKSFDYMKKGVSIFIFPEGTRSKNDDETQLGMFHNGSFKAAQRTGCAVIPVAVSGADKIFEKHRPWIRSGRMTVAFGKPVYYKDLTKEEQKNIGDTFADIISKMLAEIS